MTWGVRLAGATSAIIGGFFLTAWFAGWAARWSAAGAIVVKTNMALCQVLAGAALLLVATPAASQRRRLAGAALALVVLIVAGLTFGEHVFQYDLGIDLALATEAPGAPATASPNRMGPLGSASMVLLAAGLLALAGARRSLAPHFGLAVCVLNLVPAIGFLYGIEEFFSAPRVTGIAWPTVVALLAMGGGLLLAHRESGPVAMLLRDDAGGRLARETLPAAVLVPVAIGWLHVTGERRGYYDMVTGDGLFALAVILFLSAMLWRSAAHLGRVAAAEAEAVRAVRSSEARLKHAQEIANVGGWEWNIGSGALVWTEQVFRQLGEQPGQFTPTFDAFRERVHPHDRALFAANIERAVADQAPFDMELRVARADGEQRVLSARGDVVRDADGAATRMVGVCLDITEHRRAEDALKRSHDELEARVAERTAELNTVKNRVDAERRRFKDVLDQLPAYLILLTEDHHVAFANRFFVERFGESGGRRCYEYLFGRPAPCENCESYAVLRTGGPAHWEWTGPDGRNYDIHDFPFKDTDGSTLIMEVGLDITELKRGQAALRAERQRLFDVLETLPAMICLLTPDHRIAFANRSYRDRFGDSGGRRCHEHLFGRSEPCPFCESYAVLETGQPRHWEVAVPDGGVVDVYAVPFTDADGSPMILEMNADITERRGIEAELERHRGRLEDLVRERTAQLEAANAQLRVEIAERKQVELELERTARQRQLALDAARLGWWHYDPASRVASWDDRYGEIFGVSGHRRLNDEILAQIIHPDDLPGLWSQVEAALDPADPQPFAAQYRINRPDGATRWIEAYGSASFDGEGESRRPTDFVGTVADVTERKQGERERESTVQFLGLINSSATLNSLIEQATSFFRAQSGCEAVGMRLREGAALPYCGDRGSASGTLGVENSTGVFGVDERAQRGEDGDAAPDCLCGDVLRARFDPARAYFTAAGSFWTNGAAELLAAPGVVEHEIRARDCCDAAGYESVALIALRAGGRGLGLLQFNDRRPGRFTPESIAFWERLAGYLAVAIAKTRAEDELRASRQDLDRAQAVAHCGSWRLNVQRDELLWSDENWRIFGAPAGTPLTYETFLDSVHPDDRAFVHEKWSAALRGAPYDIEHRIVVGDAVKWVREKAELEFDAHGVLLGGFGTTQDVTEIKQAKDALAAAKAAAEAANVAKSQFLANMSHELRTPMNAILGMTDLALSEELPGAVRDYLQTAKESADVLLELLNEILDFSRIEAGHFELESERFSLRDTVEQVVRTVGVRAYEKGLELACDVADEAPDAVLGDALRLRQVLLNLLNNAIRFTPKGEVVVQVAVDSQTPTEASLHFSVIDTGIGIAPEFLDKIFTPFTQADASTTRRFGGSGLGLAICSRLVTLMNGRIWVESQPGVGSRFQFVVRLPLAAEEAQSAAAAPVDREVLRGLPVLVIAENKTSRRILLHTLASWQMRADEAADVPAGLARIHEAVAAGRPYQVVLADAVIPGIDGFTLLRWLETDQRLVGAVILMHSAADRRRFPDEFRALKAFCLEKPLSRSALLDAIARVIGARASAPEGADSARVVEPVRGRSLRVLLAEDAPANQKLVLHVLAKRGHEVAVAQNGRDALELLQRQDVDVVLMDVQMPEMDGFVATAAIRNLADQKKARVPIIAMTAHALKGDRERCLAAGMDAYISKPVRGEELIAVIERIADADGAGKPEARPATPGRDAGGADDFDLPAAIRECLGEFSTFQDMVGGFFEEADPLLSRMRAALKTGQATDLAYAAHRLCGTMLYLGARRAVEAARRVEGIARSGDLAEAARSMDELERRVQRLKEALTPHRRGDDP